MMQTGRRHHLVAMLGKTVRPHPKTRCSSCKAYSVTAADRLGSKGRRCMTVPMMSGWQNEHVELPAFRQGPFFPNVRDRSCTREW